MLATSSSKTERLLLGTWIAGAAVNVALMYIVPGIETIPFHLVWIGLSLVYGFTVWRPLTMVVALLAVAVTTGYILAIRARDGVIGWQETTEVPLMTAVFVVMVWHVHRRQQALAEVARLADAEGRRAERQRLFVRLASHELRTPITIARGYVEMVRGAVRDPAVDADIAIVLDELDKLARLTQRLLTLMQVDGQYERRVTDIDAELAHVVRRWEPTADRLWTVRSAVGGMRVNRERLEAALDALLENAVRFTGPGDRIDLTGALEEDTWVLTVTDSGVGMAEVEAAALTANGKPLGPTATGSGLGLAIVRTVVESWGGIIRVSGRPGAGTTVTLRIPIPAAHKDAADGEASAITVA
jgi:signal transduction histidine kinase